MQRPGIKTDCELNWMGRRWSKQAAVKHHATTFFFYSSLFSKQGRKRAVAVNFYCLRTIIA
ncbi:unnamed protein product, partial [Linum tenue]